MKRISAVLLAAACARPIAPVASVRVPSVTARSAEGASGTLLPECRIVGTGERPPEETNEGTPFDVFSSIDASAPAMRIEIPSSVHLAWSRFPSRPSKRGRARVELGGQSHVRFTGWSELGGRVFSAKRRLYAHAGHLWARRGARVEMSAFEDGLAVATVATPFASPKTLVVRGSCDDVAYDAIVPLSLEEAPEGTGIVTNRNVSIDLHDAPGGRPFESIVFAEAGAEVLHVLARADGFVRVAALMGDVGFDAWVPEAQTSEALSHGSGMGYGYGSSHCGGIGVSESGTVSKDTPLFVGKSPARLAGAFVEKNAYVTYDSSEAKTVGAVVLVPFELGDHVIVAPPGSSFWIAKDAIAPP